jgi:hypothetical protein
MMRLRPPFLVALFAVLVAGCPRPVDHDAGETGTGRDVTDGAMMGEASMDAIDAMDANDDAFDAGNTADAVDARDVVRRDVVRPDTGMPPPETCAGPFAPCTPMDGTTRFVRLRGTIVSMNDARDLICDGEVLFANDTGHIVCVGEDCSSAPEAAGAQVVCANGVIYPGIIDPHQHTDYNHLPVFRHTALYDNRNTWRNHEPLYDDFKIAHRNFGSTVRTNQLLAERYGEARIMMAGGTAISGTAGNLLSDSMISGWVRNLDSTSNTNSGLNGPFIDPDIDAVVVSSSTGAANLTSTATHLMSVHNRMTTNANYRAYVPHIGEGIEANARAEYDVAQMYGVITDHTAIVHCTACSSNQFQNMRDVGASLIWSPQSNMDLYGQTANVTVAHNLGVLISLGVDWTPSGSINSIEELQCAAQLNSTYYDHAFSDRELVEMITVNPAVAFRLDDPALPAPLGRIDVGYEADLVVVAGDRMNPYRAMLDARAEQIRLVTIAGQGQYGDPDALTGAIVNGMACMAVPDGISPAGMTGVCGTAKTICTQPSDVGMLADTIRMALDAARMTDMTNCTTRGYCYAYDLFPLFRCGPPDLSRCHFGHGVINRRDATGTTIAAVSGMPMPGTDDDGDSVPNATDNCPTVFNPPFDISTTQDDSNNDGVGDACDPTACTNGDGTNACPYMGATTPMLTIPTIRDPSAMGHPASGAVVTTSGIVTAVKNLGTSRSFIIQDPTATAWAGIQVFVGSASITVSRGDNVVVSGTVANFRGMDQLDARSGMYMAMGTGTIPTPIAVTPSDIATGGPHARDYQSMLVTVSSVAASSATSGTDFNVQPAGMCMTAGGLIVTSVYANDLMPSPFPATACQTYTSITGIVYSFGPSAGPFDSKLAPRDTADVVSP